MYMNNVALIKSFISDFECTVEEDCNNGKGICANNKTCDCKPGWQLHDCFGKKSFTPEFSIDLYKSFVKFTGEAENKYWLNT